jgi:predicted DNA-binding transcriptional regulator AlpA
MSNDTDIVGAKDAHDVLEFCVRHGISRAMFYKLEKLGQGPRIMKVGSLTRITKEAAADWRREREAASANTQTAAA